MIEFLEMVVIFIREAVLWVILVISCFLQFPRQNDILNNTVVMSTSKINPVVGRHSIANYPEHLNSLVKKGEMAYLLEWYILWIGTPFKLKPCARTTSINESFPGKSRMYGHLTYISDQSSWFIQAKRAFRESKLGRSWRLWKDQGTRLDTCTKNTIGPTTRIVWSHAPALLC